MVKMTPFVLLRVLLRQPLVLCHRGRPFTNRITAIPYGIISLPSWMCLDGNNRKSSARSSTEPIAFIVNDHPMPPAYSRPTTTTRSRPLFSA